MKRIGLLASLATLAVLASISGASAHFIDAYLAECTANAAGACTELTATGYARQPVFFNQAVRGVAPLGSAYYFGPASVGTFTGRALYDAPTGGNLLMVLPFATPLVVASPGDYADVGALKLTFTALVPYLYGEAYIGSAASGAVLGTDTDGSTITSGHTLTFLRGDLLVGTLAPT